MACLLVVRRVEQLHPHGLAATERLLDDLLALRGAVADGERDRAMRRGFLFARLQEGDGPMHAALATTGFFWLFHWPTFLLDTGSWRLAAWSWLF